MSSDHDQTIFERSVQSNDEPLLFNDRKITYITDTSNGSFTSGMVNFDLGTLSSQADFINLNEAVIQLPIRITAKLTADATGCTLNPLSVIPKNGFHQWVDTCQLVINGTTIQSAQSYENVAATFRILSNWSQDNLNKWGPSCGFALDDCTGDGVNNTTGASTSGLNNATYSTVADSVKGYFGASTIANSTAGTNINNALNKGLVKRASMLNYNIGTSGAAITTLASSILGATNIRNSGKAHLSRVAGTTDGTVMYSSYIMATIRLKDLCDIDQLPMMKNLKGFLYLGINSGTVTLTGASSVISVVASKADTGKTVPFLINDNSAVSSAGPGLNIGAGTPTVQIVGTIDGTSPGSNNVTGSSAGPLLTSARLICPLYSCNPRCDEALSKTQRFSTMEKIVYPLTVGAGAPVNTTITSGVSNPRKLVILPMWQKLGASGALYENPELSPFDTSPATSGPFSWLSNFQVYCANKPLYNFPIQYTYDQWISEQVELGLNGAGDDQLTSGLLTQQQYEQNHSFVYVDLSRRIDSEDGSSKSVQISFTNPSSTFGMKCICVLFYERRWECNTSSGVIRSV